MTEFYCNNMPTHTCGDIPDVGALAPNFVLTASDLSLVSLHDYVGQPVMLNVFVSIDTPVCLKSCHDINDINLDDEMNILCVSMDTPFAMARLERQAPERVDKFTLLSDFRNRSFGADYKLTIEDGPLAGFLARAIFVLDKSHHIVYRKLTEEITCEPDIKLAMEALRDNL